MGTRLETRPERHANSICPAASVLLERILFEEDPIGINYGDNRDEYEPEARTILPKLTTCRTTAEVQSVVYSEFVNWFSESAGPLSNYARTAERVFLEVLPLLRSLSAPAGEQIAKG